MTVLVWLVWHSQTAQALELDGDFTQGGLVFGHAEPGSAVDLDGKPVKVSPYGYFLLGFGRDHPPSATLSVTEKGRTEVRSLTITQREWQVQRIDGLPSRQVTPDPKAIARIKDDNRQIGAVRRLDSDRTWFLGGFDWPVRGRISGVFGSQRILNGKPRRPHNGLDIAAPTGTPIKAMADGVVALVHPDMFYTGKSVMIDHGHGLSSVYVHMSEILVTDGQQVSKGTPIGRIGKTGRATGPHLHWGVSLFRTHLDPRLLVEE